MDMRRRSAACHCCPECDVGNLPLLKKAAEPESIGCIRVQPDIHASPMVEAELLVHKRLSESADRKRLMKLL